jgi:FkbM family methyltransferase
MGFTNILKSLFSSGKKRKELARRKWEESKAKMEQESLPSRIVFYQQFLQPGDLVFDVGANVGNRVAAFLACDAKVIAVEPQPSCAAQLEQKFGKAITLEQVGLSDEPGELEMHIATDSTVSTFNTEFIRATQDRFRYSEWNETIKVPVTTLDALLDKYGTPRFCKIDVEGFELQVLKGLHKNIPLVSLEYCVPEMSALAKDCCAYLHRLSPQGLFNYSIGESMQWARQEWMSYEDFITHMGSAAFVETLFGDIYFKSI